MNDRPVSVILDALESVTGHKPHRNGRQWQARCPAHDDRRPSLSISEGDDGRALVRCHAGCRAEAIVSVLGLELRDLMPQRVSASPRPAARRASKTSFRSTDDHVVVPVPINITRVRKPPTERMVGNVIHI